MSLYKARYLLCGAEQVLFYCPDSHQLMIEGKDHAFLRIDKNRPTRHARRIAWPNGRLLCDVQPQERQRIQKHTYRCVVHGVMIKIGTTVTRADCTVSREI